MIATYIKELLATNNRVIIPQFGAFLVRATSKHKDSKDLSKKIDDIYFSPFLKFNDELLVNHIVKKENITQEEANTKIKDFVNDINKSLEAGKSYAIEGMGDFSMDKQGKIQFVVASGAKAETTEKKEEPKPKAAAKTSAAKAKETAKKEPEKKPAVKKTTPPKKEEKTETKKEEPQKVKAEQAKATTVKEKAATAAKTEKSSEPLKPKEGYAPKRLEEKDGLNKGLIITIAISVPLAVIFILAILNFDVVKDFFSKNEGKVKTEQIAKKKPAKEDAAKVKKEDEKRQKETTSPDKKETQTANKTTTKQKAQAKKTTAKPAGKKYYIIAGSFQNEKYADAFMEDLKKQGYKPEKLPIHNGMYRVSYNSFPDKRKAQAELNFITKEKGKKAWLLYQ